MEVKLILLNVLEVRNDVRELLQGLHVRKQAEESRPGPCMKGSRRACMAALEEEGWGRMAALEEEGWGRMAACEEEGVGRMAACEEAGGGAWLHARKQAGVHGCT